MLCFINTFTGKCPSDHANKTLEIEYNEVPRSVPRAFKKGLIQNIYCNDRASCTFLDEHSRCPIYLEAPVTVFP